MPMTTADYNEVLPATEPEPEPSTEARQIMQPGCYVWTESGNLLRVLPDASTWETAGLQDSREDGRSGWTMISDDPFVPLTTARLIAANLDIDPSR